MALINALFRKSRTIKACLARAFVVDTELEPSPCQSKSQSPLTAIPPESTLIEMPELEPESIDVEPEPEPSPIDNSDI